MALQKQKAEVVLAKGIDTKTDSKMVLQSELLTLENGEFDSSGAINKRKGYVKLPNTVYRANPTGVAVGYSGPIAQAEGLAVLDEELLLFEGDNLVTRFEGNDKWDYRSPATSCTTEAHRVLDATRDQFMMQVVYANGLAVYIWVEQSGSFKTNILYSIEDYETGARIIDRAQLEVITASTNCLGVRLVAAGNTVVALWHDTTKIRIAKIADVTTIGTNPWNTPADLYTNVHATNSYFDAVVFDASTLAVTYNTNAAAIRTGLVSTSTLAETSGTTVAESADECIAINIDEEGTDVVIAYSLVNGNAHEIRSIAYSSIPTPTVRYGPVLVASESTIIEQVVVGPGISTTHYSCFYQIEDIVYSGLEVDGRSIVKTTGAIHVTFTSLFNVGIASTIFKRGEHVFFHGTKPSETQPVYVLFRVERTGDQAIVVSPTIVGKYQAGLAGGMREVSNPSWVRTDGSTERWIWAAALKTRFVISEDLATITARKALGLCRVDFGNESRIYETIEKNRSLLIGGGVPQVYDGVAIYDNGFALAPEFLELVLNPDNAPSATPANYQFVAVYEWADVSGQIHQSAPSEVGSITIDAVGERVDMKVTNYSWINKDTRLVIYIRHTEESDVFFRQTKSIFGGIYGKQAGVGVGAVATYTGIQMSGAADLDTSGTQLLYTTGGIVQNDQPPSCSAWAEWKGRVWCAGLETENTVWFSKTIVPNEAVAFNAGFVVSVGAETERIVAIVGMDETLVVFKADSIWVITGEPPTDLGVGATLTTHKIPADSGCVSPKSVAVIPQGVIFKSEDGISLVTRGLTVDPSIGMPVSAHNGNSVTSAVVVAEKAQVRFTLGVGDTALVYDYHFNLWYTFTNHDAADAGAAVIWKDTYVFAESDGDTFTEDTKYLDDGVHVARTIETAWIKLGGTQGIQRLYKALLLGENLGAHSLRVSVGFNYDSAYTDVKDWDEAAIAALPREQVEVRPSKQVCESFRLKIEEVAKGGSPEYEAAFTLSHIMLEVGVKKGLHRTAGTTRR